MDKIKTFNAMNFAFLFLCNFPYYKDLIEQLDETKSMQIYYINKYRELVKECNNQSDLAMLRFYFILDREHRFKFLNCIAKHYNIQFE